MKNQDPSQELLQSILSLYTDGNFQQALTESSQMLKNFPNSINLLNIAGASNSGLMQFDSAIKNYEQVLIINPLYAEALYNMGIAQKCKGDLEMAIHCYKEAIKIKPSYAEAHFSMGNALKDKGELDLALISYNESLKIKPKNAGIYNNMGNILKDKGDLEMAIEHFKKALKIDPEYANAYNNIGNALKNNNPEVALENYNQALKIKPEFAKAKLNMVNLLTTYTSKKENLNLIVLVNEKIRKINHITSGVISDEQAIGLFSKSESCINSFGLNIKTQLSQAYRRNSVDLNCKRHKSIFNRHKIIPKFCFNCYKVQIEPKSIIELIKLFIIFDQLKLNKNNTRKCNVELRPEISGFYKGLIYCSDLQQANQIAAHLDKIIDQRIGSGLTSKIKRGCSEYAITFPDYKEINNSGTQLMSYIEDWKVIEEVHDREKPIYAEKGRRESLSGLNLSDILVIQKWIDYAKGIGDPTVDLLNQNTIYYPVIYNKAKERLDKFNYIY